ncbi:MAG: hypothetical protein E7660_07520 [Ruminococcaceae bacterium]|nr:hypothetical protein [Oscillospiraceae bacterium]
MFLTEKSRRKILIKALCSFFLGVFSFAFWVFFRALGDTDNTLLVIGMIAFFLCLLEVFLGRYSEGKGKLINHGNKLVRNELKPAEFIKHYELLKKSDDLIVGKPSMEVLHLVAVAYDLLDDRENVFSTVDEMIASASDKKKNFAKLIKSSFLFSCGRTYEAESIFVEVQKQKLDFACISLVDAILKSDRAMAMGDYRTAEAHFLKMLERSFPKLDNLGRLIVNYKLGEIYEKLEDIEKATSYYRYCASNGGETTIKISAIEKLQLLK